MSSLRPIMQRVVPSPISDKQSICTSGIRPNQVAAVHQPVIQSDEKIYRLTGERPLLNEYKIKDKQIRLVRVQPEDVELVTDFMSDVAGRWEPTTVSTNTSSDEFRPYIAASLEDQTDYSILVMDDARVVGAGIARCIELDRKKAIEPKLREDYGELIDSLKDVFPSRQMGRVVAPAYDLCEMVSHFLPNNVDRILRCDLACVQKSYTGGNIIRRIFHEWSKMGLQNGIEYADGQTTAMATYRSLQSLGSKIFFEIPYETMFDYGEQIHKNIPLIDGGTAVYGHIFDLKTTFEKTTL